MTTNEPARPIKLEGPGENPAFHEWPGGLTWIAHPGEAMQRASHALAVGADGALAGSAVAPDTVDLWLVDPLAAAGLDDRLAERGEIAGIVVLSGYHSRDAGAFGRRYDVPVYLPQALAPLEPTIDAEVTMLDGRLPGSSCSLLTVRSWPVWREAAIHERESGTLVVAESLVSQPAGTGPDERLAVAPYLRLWPPRAAFEDREASRLLVGHGEPLFDDVNAAIETALANARSGCPSYLRHNYDYLLRAWAVALRS